jgi:hypothetical protein
MRGIFKGATYEEIMVGIVIGIAMFLFILAFAALACEYGAIVFVGFAVLLLCIFIGILIARSIDDV